MTEQVVLLQEAVQKPFEAKQPSGLKRLMDLLSRTMIRAAKKDLVTIPPLYYKVKILSLLVIFKLSSGMCFSTRDSHCGLIK